MQKGNVAVPFLLISLVMTIIGYYFFSHSPKSKSPNFPINQVLEFDKKYSNQNLGFEFKYDKDLISKEDSEEDFNERGNGNFRKNFKGYVFYEPGKFIGAALVLGKDNSYDTNPFTVWVFENPDNLTVSSWYGKYWYYPFVWGDFTYTGKTVLAPHEEATISGQIGKSGIIDYQPGNPKFIYVSSSGKMYLFRIIGDEGEKILSTFKFLSINQADEKCVAGGCSGQLCLEEKESGQIASTCEYKEEYGCYKNAKCEKQSDGKCGWTQTEELTSCLDKANQGKFCGGIAGITCPTGYKCKLDGNYPDAGGKCVKN